MSAGYNKIVKSVFLSVRFYFYVLIVVFILCPVLIVGTLLSKLFEWIFGNKREKNIEGDVAVITGSAVGLGKQIALELAQRGCKLAIVDINFQAALLTAEYITKNYNIKTKAYKVDVSKYEQVQDLQIQVKNDLGPVTILVNNAGVLALSDPLNPKVEEIQNMINVNLTSHFWTNKVFLPDMKQLKRGYILAISSIASFYPITFNSCYTSSKFGIRGHMRVLRQELLIDNFNDIHAVTAFPYFLNTNKDVNHIFDSIGLGYLMPAISGEEAAAHIVRRMLQNHVEIHVPRSFSVFYRIFELIRPKFMDYIMATVLKLSNAKARLIEKK